MKNNGLDHDFVTNELIEAIRNTAHRNYIDMARNNKDSDFFLSRAYTNAVFTAMAYSGYEIIVKKDGKEFVVKKGE